jgi:hypothetical protein
MACHALPLYTLWVGMDAPKYHYGILFSTTVHPVGDHGCPKISLWRTMRYPSTPCGWQWTPLNIPRICHALPVYALKVPIDARKYLYSVPCATRSLDPLSPGQGPVRIPSQPNRVYKTHYHQA